ncbi:alpha/beta hydrolase [Aeromicrobium sp. CF3.5]|uniref:alpha/beta hydrolase n=1 Tax=Aeromicrobium sp. CF3.5 TaxID=3373078 RepID=UPI003EE74873
MTAFVLIHGAGDSGWAWHLLEAELQARGHTSVAPDLPAENDELGYEDYADVVLDAAAPLGDPSELVVVGHSLGGFTAPIVAEKANAKQLVLLAAMIPAPGESTNDWWSSTGYMEAASAQSQRDGGLTGNSDEMISFYNGVPEELAREAAEHALGQSERPMGQPWPLTAWPDVPTRFLLCRDDRFFPADFFRALVPARLGITPEEVPGGHCVMLGQADELADALLAGLD